MSSCKKCRCGPGYATPQEAIEKGLREKLLYVITVQPNLEEPHGDYLSTVDVDPESPTYCQVKLIQIIMQKINLVNLSFSGHPPYVYEYNRQ